MLLVYVTTSTVDSNICVVSYYFRGIFLPTRVYCQFIASSTSLKEKMHETNNKKWDMYYSAQGQKLKEMQESREVKEQKVNEMQEGRKIKIMATDTSHMTVERQEYFAEEVAHIMKTRRQRAADAETQE